MASVSAWEKNRISWPDELRDLTERIPSLPNLTVQQLTISSAGPGTAVATFRGVGASPEIIAQMENNLRDKYHDIRVPGVREQQEGNKVVSTFQATLTIRKRCCVTSPELMPQRSSFDFDRQFFTRAFSPASGEKVDAARGSAC